MRIAIMGAGAVGGYFGGLLSLAGHEVTFIARGEHLRAMQQNGLTLETPKGALRVTNARFVTDPATAAASGACDVVLFAVKAYDIEAAAEPLKPLVDAGSTVYRCSTASIIKTASAPCWARPMSSAALR